MRRGLMLFIGMLCIFCRADATVREFHLTDYLRHDWRDEVVHFPVDFQRGECDGAHYRLTRTGDAQPVPAQLIEMTRYPDGSVRQARLVFRCDLPAGQTRGWRLETGASAPAQHVPALAREGRRMVLSSGPLSLLVPVGKHRYDTPIAAAAAPAPLLGVKGPDGIWRGHGRLESAEHITSYQAEVIENGPVLLAYRIEYRFTGDKYYRVTLRLYHGLNYAQVSEEANVDPDSRFLFSAYAGFAPTHYVAPDRDAQPLSYREDRRLLRFFFNTYFHQIYDFKDWVAFFHDAPSSKDYLAFVKVHGGAWSSPLHNAIHFAETREPDLRLEATLRPCRREWLVAMFDRTRLHEEEKGSPRPDVLRRLCVSVGFAALDRVKEWTLAWPLSRRERPVSAEERADAAQLLQGLSGLVNSSLVDGPYGENHALGYGQRIAMWRLYPRVAGTGALSGEDERFVRAALAYLAYTAMERDYFAWYLPLLPHEDTADAEEPLQNWHYNFYMMNTNFDASRFCGVAEIALSLRDHPEFSRFMAHYTQCVRLHLNNTFSEDGVYHESISYQCWDLFLLTRTAARVRQETGADLFAEPRLHRAFHSLLELATPPDARYPGAPRALPHFGSHDPMDGMRGTWGELLTLASAAYAERDPELAAGLSWLWQQLGCTGAGPTAVPRPPALQSTRLRGWGAVLHAKCGTPRESYVLFRCDPFVGRYLNEENSFYLFARGRPLILTPSDGFADIAQFSTTAENTVSFNGLGNYEQNWGNWARWRGMPRWADMITCAARYREIATSARG